MTASNEMNTTDQYRQSYQYSSTIDGLLKNVYLPALNNTTFQATPLLAMFGDFGGAIDFAGNKIIKAFKHQGAGGFGAISEGGDWVKGRKQKGFQGYENIKYLNAFFSLTGPAAKTVKSGQGAYVDAVSSAMDDTLKLAKMNMERMLGGKGDGELCTFVNAEITQVEASEYIGNTNGGSGTSFVAGTTLTALGGAYMTNRWLQNGIRVNIVDDSDWDGTLAAADLDGPFEVGNVDYREGTFSLLNVTETVLTLATAGSYHVILENSYGEVEEAGGTTDTDLKCLELNGLYNLVSDGSSDGESNYTTIWNRPRASFPSSLKSMVELAAGAELDEELLMGWIQNLVHINEGVPNTLVTDPKSRLKYFGNHKEDRRFNTQVMEGPMGFRSLGVTIDEYNLMIHSLASLVPGTLMMIDVNSFKFAKATNGFIWNEEGGRILHNYEGRDAMYATAVNYCQFLCEDPKGQFKATGLSY